ncbi:hypothetical protein BH09MYX1_BH09MYX1_62010 [soil metagenome]
MTTGLTPIAGEPDRDGGDCVACGRCCHHSPETVSLFEDDEARMGDILLAEYTVLEARPPGFRFLKNDGSRCAALDVSTPGAYPCKLYEKRPQGCRTVEPGSPCCMEARSLGHLGTSVEFRR